MSKPLLGTKIAILAANGFSEQDMTAAQRALAEAGANARIVSPEQGLVNGWTGTAWGHHFAVDSVLSTALGADYDMLVIPGGQRSHDKLKLTAHTKRFVGSFMAARKPVALMGDAARVLVQAERAEGVELTVPADAEAEIAASGAKVSEVNPAVSGNVFSGWADGADRMALARAVVDFLSSGAAEELKAA